MRVETFCWAVVVCICSVAWVPSASAEQHVFAAAACVPVGSTSSYSYGAPGDLEYSGTSGVGAFTCTFDNETESGSSSAGLAVYVRDYSDESGNDGNVGCQAYTTSAFTNNISWGSFSYSSGVGVQTVMLGSTTVYGTGIIGLHCRVPARDTTGSGLGNSKLYRIFGSW